VGSSTKAIIKERKRQGYDSKKRWGNSGLKGHGVNSPAMMKARANHEALESKRSEKKEHKTKYHLSKGKPETIKASDLAKRMGISFTQL
jgi:flagellar biosynthesis/type III secretory pathway M-ring protein FliF/YscJ